jgi:hypothetical protein
MIHGFKNQSHILSVLGTPVYEHTDVCTLARIWQYVTSKESLVTGSMILGSYSLPRNLCKLLVEVRTTIRYQSWSILGSGCI